MVTDPVCGMRIDEQSAAGSSEYQGRKFYFCSDSCKKKFDQRPEQYASKA